MSSAEVVGATAGDTGGTAIEVAVGKRGRQPLTGAERCRRIAELGIDTKSARSKAGLGCVLEIKSFFPKKIVLLLQFPSS